MFHIHIWKQPFDQIQPQIDAAIENGFIKPGTLNWMALSEFTNRELQFAHHRGELNYTWVNLAAHIQQKLYDLTEKPYDKLSIFQRAFNLRMIAVKSGIVDIMDENYGIPYFERAFLEWLPNPVSFYLEIPEKFEYLLVQDAIAARNTKNTIYERSIITKISDLKSAFRFIKSMMELDENLFSQEFGIAEWNAARSEFYQT